MVQTRKVALLLTVTEPVDNNEDLKFCHEDGESLPILPFFLGLL